VKYDDFSKLLYTQNFTELMTIAVAMSYETVICIELM
jgi:hypothetical protein